MPALCLEDIVQCRLIRDRILIIFSSISITSLIFSLSRKSSAAILIGMSLIKIVREDTSQCKILHRGDISRERVVHGMTLKVMSVEFDYCQRAVILLTAIVKIVLHILRFQHRAQILSCSPP